MKNNSNRKTNKPAETQTPALLREQIETRAYQIYLTSGGAYGSELQHPRVVQVQFQNIASNEVSEFKDPSKQVVAANLRRENLIYPFAKANNRAPV